MTEFGKFDDVIDTLVDFILVQTEHSRVEVNVFAAGEVRMEAGAKLEQTGQLALGFYRTFIRVENAGTSV